MGALSNTLKKASFCEHAAGPAGMVFCLSSDKKSEAARKCSFPSFEN